MANPKHLEILERGVKVWNRWREENPEIWPDLYGANLRGVDLSGANLSEADLGEANLSEADLRRANLRGARLIRADLSEADLSAAHLSAAILHRVNLRGANLFKADLSGAHTSEAQLGGTNLREADLSSNDLSGRDFSGKDLSRANLSRANLSGANLSRTNLSRTNLSRTNLSGANLEGADIREADLGRTDLSGINLSGMNLSGANLNQTVLIGTNFSNANLSNCSVYGIAAWNLNLEGATQSNLVITPSNEPAITVDNLEVAQFIYVLLHNEKIRYIIDTITSKVVLILGRFTPERKAILDALRDELRRRDYLPVLFDFEKPSSRDLTETISTLAHMARFVIADITDAKSIPQELQAIVPGLPSVPVQPLIASSDYEYGMFEHFRHYPWVLDTYQYDTPEDLLASLKERVIDPAESKAKELTSPAGRALVSAPAENPKAPAP
jgi:uncharacterized protein YjbI with pentapeptide repeats